MLNQPSCVHLIIKVRLQCSTKRRRRPGCQFWHRMNGLINGRHICQCHCIGWRTFASSMKAWHSSRRGCVLWIVARNILRIRSKPAVGLFTTALVMGQDQCRTYRREDIATCCIVIFFENVDICNGVHKNRDDTMMMLNSWKDIYIYIYIRLD